VDWLIVAVCFAAMLLGGNHFVIGIASIGRKLGMSPVMIGATFVAIGTSLPEWAISVISAWQEAPSLSAGNVVGSNICNICIILGVAGVIRTISVARSWIYRDGLIMLIATFSLFAVTYDGIITRPEGGLLLAGAVATILLLLRAGGAEPEEGEPFHWFEIPRAILGIAAVIVASNFFVEAAQRLATDLGVSEWIIGITVAAVGTSLPELVTAVAASVQRRGGIVIGNILGSNTMNIFFVLGSASLVRPLESAAFSLSAVAIFSGLMVLPLALLATQLRLDRWEGALLLTAGLVWYVYACSPAAG